MFLIYRLGTLDFVVSVYFAALQPPQTMFHKFLHTSCCIAVQLVGLTRLDDIFDDFLQASAPLRSDWRTGGSDMVS